MEIASKMTGRTSSRTQAFLAAAVTSLLWLLFTRRNARTTGVLKNTGRAMPPLPSIAAQLQPGPLAGDTTASPFLPSVSGFALPARRCTGNPFLAGWGAADFDAAALALIDHRLHSSRQSLDRLWHVTGHHVFDGAPRNVSCTPLARVGEDGDGGKVLCGLSALRAPCVVYSLGSNCQFDFEEAMLEATPCELHTFDCTVEVPSARCPKELPPRIHFHPICLGSAPGQRSLRSLAAELGHSRIDLLKMDIEGFEFAVLDSLLEGVVLDSLQQIQRGSNADAGAVSKLMPAQISLEVHTSAMPGVTFAGSELSAGELEALWRTLADLGYVPVSREDNPFCSACSEFTVVRAFC